MSTTSDYLEDSASGQQDLVPDQHADYDATSSGNWERLKEMGNTAFREAKYDEAIKYYSHALQHVSNQQQEAMLYSNRSAAKCGLSQSIRKRPAGLSERYALFGEDPHQLAMQGLKDAERAAELMPTWHKTYSRKGLALFLMERYQEAATAYRAGLELAPDNQVLQDGLKEVLAVLKDEADAAAAAGGSQQPTPPVEQPEESVAKRQRTTQHLSADDCECTLCMRLMYDPVTTPCGHTFCKACFMRVMDHSSKCPMCRTILHMGHELSVTIAYANLLMKCFPEEYEARRLEEQLATSGSGEEGLTFTLPLFVMSVVLPGESMRLNIFEPRYRLMVRRCMEGNRRFGMAQVNPLTGDVEDVLVSVEIVDCEPQPDGRYCLDIVGRERVRILRSWEQDGYRVARVLAFKDTPPDEEPAVAAIGELSADVEKVLLGVVKKMISFNPRLQYRMQQDINSKPPSGNHEAISFWAAGMLSSARLLPVTRMELLRATTTKERLERCKRELDMLAAHPGGSCRFM